MCAGPPAAHLAHLTHRPARWKALDYQGCDDTFPGFPTSVRCGVWQARINYPNCWDGVRLSSSDGSHIAFRAADDTCPPTHPVLMVRQDLGRVTRSGSAPPSTPTPHPRLLEVVEASHSWLGGFHPARIGWWAGVMNTLGAIGFLVNAVLWYRVQSTVATTIALLVGSVFFFVGSYIAWLEQCLD